MFKLLSLTSTILGGSLLVGLGSLSLGSSNPKSQTSLSLVSTEGEGVKVKGRCKVVYANTDTPSVSETRSDNPADEESWKEKVIDGDIKKKVEEDCKSGKTSYLSFENGKWIYKFSSG
ncbi:hypothetical protein HF1_04520 [Mycoplasma haemofelis str. Langford 1]|uniref:Uncharacterized protein n=1 Tax=Mycoplasma haemofelis (strain Langford 1) TaxID=941640 RepID=E8ZH39_MYCHL|nr:hypothetical protein [Mycoplasma haemofelis]CBY92460.1 hypothetical protein HF1_04520 [Mycoplasma haemofelis str. Langford 1]